MIEAVSAIIAVVSLVVAVVFGIRNHRLGQENTDLQQRLLALEQTREKDRVMSAQKAKLSASIESDWSAAGRANPRLSIRNEGSSEARQVVAKIGGRDIAEHELVPDGATGFIIGPDSAYRCPLAVCFGNAPPFDFEVAWEDGSGEPGLYRTTLTF